MVFECLISIVNYKGASVNYIVPVYKVDNVNNGGKSNHMQFFFALWIFLPLFCLFYVLGRIATYVNITEYYINCLSVREDGSVIVTFKKMNVILLDARDKGCFVYIITIYKSKFRLLSVF